MEIQYTTNKYAIIYFNLFTNRLFIIITPILIGIVVAFGQLQEPTYSLFDVIFSFITFYILGLTGFILIFIVTPLFSYGKKNAKSVFCKHKMTFTDDNFIEETEYNRNEYQWNAVLKFKHTKTFILIYLSKNYAFVIPKKDLSNVNELIELLSKKVGS